MAQAQHAEAERRPRIGQVHDPEEREADRVAALLVAPARPACTACAAADAPCPACAAGQRKLRRS
ncbi:hypothetical protein, partial [Falsiroseomonas oryzae]|uniref:hypothetical protein n=1 Tax=Falsiroseomonas oryzae TaxID=2766473 RepID=UPI0022EB53AC